MARSLSDWEELCEMLPPESFLPCWDPEGFEPDTVSVRLPSEREREMTKKIIIVGTKKKTFILFGLHFRGQDFSLTI